MSASAEYLRTERRAAQASGRKPAYCPPEKQSVNNVEILTHFRASSRMATTMGTPEINVAIMLLARFQDLARLSRHGCAVHWSACDGPGIFRQRSRAAYAGQWTSRPTIQSGDG